MYHAILNLEGKEHIGKGNSALEAMGNIPLTWDDVKTKGTLTLKKGKLSAERFLFMKDTRAVVNSKHRQMHFAKSLETLLK